MPIAPSAKPSRRDFLQFAGSAAAFVALAAGPFAALAQTPGAAPIKIATIGAGREGGALGTLFAKAGHPVMFSSRHPEQLKDLVAGVGALAKAGTVAEAVAFGDVVLLVVPYGAVAEIGKEHGKALAAKALILDVSNPIARIAGDDQSALALASRLIKEIGFEPVVVGGLAMGKYLVPGTPLAPVHTPEEIRQIVATLK